MENSDLNKKWPIQDSCPLCDKGKLIFNKSSFEQYESSIYQCDNCKKEFTPREYSIRADTIDAFMEVINSESGQAKHDHELCTCGHKKSNHSDLSNYTGWGLGICEMGICPCKKFDCVDCFKPSPSISKEHVEDLLHKCLDPYLPPIIGDSSQILSLIAETIDQYYQSRKGG